VHKQHNKENTDEVIIAEGATGLCSVFRRYMEKKFDGSLYELVVICPSNPVYGVFKTIVIIACMVSSIVYAYEAAFRYDVDGYWCPDGTYSPT
jgi:hypothetical protein